MWHGVVKKTSTKNEKHSQLVEFWEQLRKKRKLTDKVKRNRNSEGEWDYYPDELPAASALQSKDGYEILARCKEPIEAPDHNYAYAYVNHDVVGFVVMVQSEAKDDFNTLERDLAPALKPPEKLDFMWKFKTLVSFQENAALLPATLTARDLYEAAGFATKQGFTMWNLTPNELETSRSLICVPLREQNASGIWRLSQIDETALIKFAVGPWESSCPQWLDFQIQVAKIHFLNADYNKKLGGDKVSSLRATREGIDREIDDFWESEKNEIKAKGSGDKTRTDEPTALAKMRSETATARHRHRRREQRAIATTFVRRGGASVRRLHAQQRAQSRFAEFPGKRVGLYRTHHRTHRSVANGL